MGKYKVVVAHPYKQHSFELAEGIRRKGVLYRYITTVYYKKNNLTGLITRYLRGQSKDKALKRVDKRIDPYVKQFCEGEGLLKLLTMKVGSIKKYYTKVKYHSNDRFAKKVAAYCLKHKVDAVVVYDDTSPICSEIIKKKNPNIKIILDMSAPALPYLSNVYKRDMEMSPDFADKLKSEVNKALDEKMLKRSMREIQAADYYLVASEFSKSTLICCDVDEARIKICRYGVDSVGFSPGENRNSSVLHAVYIGGTFEYKGISYLLKAFEKLKEQPVDLTIIGECNLSANEIPDNVKCVGIVMHEEVAKILKKCDFAIFPSLGDGFGFAVTEALSAGCPVICSNNAGASDLIEDEFNGFRIDAQDSNHIVERAIEMLNDRDKLKMMQTNARKSIEKLTWSRYYEEVGKSVIDICERL